MVGVTLADVLWDLLVVKVSVAIVLLRSSV